MRWTSKSRSVARCAINIFQSDWMSVRGVRMVPKRGVALYLIGDWYGSESGVLGTDKPKQDGE